MWHQRRLLWLSWVLCLFISTLAKQAWADDPRHQQILVLHSYHPSYVWTSGIHEALLGALREAKLDVDVRTEYLDWKHFPTEENLEREYSNLRKYSNLRFDLVVTSDNKATDFALARRRTLFAGSPIVFCGYNGFRPELLAGQTHVTGVAEFVDAPGTLKLAFALAPQTQHLFAICDRTETGRAVCEEVLRAVPQFNRKIDVTFIGEKESTEEVLRALSVTPSQSLILAGPFNQDREGRFLDLWELADLIRIREINLPVFHLYQEALGHGVVGGSMMSGTLQGRAAGRMAVRILRGESPDHIAVSTERTVAQYVDLKEVERFGLESANIPSGVTLLNPPKSYYERHRRLILGGLGFSLCALLAVTVLLVFRVQSERVVRRNAEQLRTLIQNMPVLACAFDERNNVVMWNRACEVVLGFSSQEVRSSTVIESLTFQESTWNELKALARGNIAQTTLELEHKDKTGKQRVIRWFSESSRFPVPGWTGWVVGVDTTEQRFAEAERTRLTLAVSQTSEGIVILDAHTAIHYANNAAIALLGRTREQIVSQRWQNVLETNKDDACVPQTVALVSLDVTPSRFNEHHGQ